MTTRRDFLKLLAGTAAIVGLKPSLALAEAKRVTVPLVHAAAAVKTVGGSATVTVEGKRIILVRASQDTVRAFDNRCTHLGCKVSWHGDTQQFVCPCHGGKFDAEGKNVAGPPPSPLKEYPAQLDGDNVIITLED